MSQLNFKVIKSFTVATAKLPLSDVQVLFISEKILSTGAEVPREIKTEEQMN